MVPDFTSAAEPRAYAIYEHYGFAHQVLKLAEEASELAAACARYYDHVSDSGDDMPWLKPVQEELADVIVLAVQLCVDMPFEEGVREAYIMKLNRQIERLRAECKANEKTYQDASDDATEGEFEALPGYLGTVDGITDASARIYMQGGTL